MASLRELIWELSTKGVSKATKDTKEVNKQFDKTKKSVTDIDLGVKTLGGTFKDSFKGIKSTLDSASSGLKNFGKDLQTKGKEISSLGGKITKATLPLTTLATAGVKMSLDLDKGIRQISTLTDENILPIAQVKKEIREMSDLTGIAQTEISESVYEALSSDVDQTKVMDFVKSGINLTRAGFTDMATVIDATTTVLNAYGDQVTDVGKIHDIFVMTQDKGKITVDELGQSIGRVIPTAAAAEVSLEQLGASYSMLTAKGQNPQIATTNLNALLAELSTTSGKADKVLRKKTGKSFKELTKNGSTLGDVLDVLNQGAIETGQSLNDMFGRSGGMAALTLISEGKEAYNEMVAIMDNATGATIANAEKMAGPGQKMAQAWNKVKNVMIDVGDIVVPTILPIIEGIGNLATMFSKLDPQMQSTVVQYGMLAIAAGPIISIVGGVISGLGKLVGLIGKLAGGTKLLSAVGGGLKLLLGGVSLKFAAIIGIAGGVIAIGQNLISNWGKIKAHAKELGGGPLAYLRAALSSTGEMFAGLGDIAGGVFDWIKDKWDGLRSFLANPIKGTISIFTGGDSGATKTSIASKASLPTKSFGSTGLGPIRADGSHASGLNYVPKNNYRAILHPGEMVLTRKTSDKFRSMGGTKDKVPQTGSGPAVVAGESNTFAPNIYITVEGNADENTVNDIREVVRNEIESIFRTLTLQRA